MTDTYEKKDAAASYDSARALPDDTMALWMDRLTNLVPPQAITRVLDLGGGTGRFATPVGTACHCPVVVVDPSAAMLQQGRSIRTEAIAWICGVAEHIPLAAASVDLVWMSQVFHHLESRPATFEEIRRVLRPAGYLVVRNGTRESDAGINWMKFFPEAQRLEEVRTPSQADIIGTVHRHRFNVIAVQTVNQVFATSYLEYYQKISQRGLSSLISIGDEAFNRGLLKLHEWAVALPPDQPVYDPVDLFVFQKNG